MASVRKKTRSNNWFACYTDANGLRRQESTGTADRKKAERIADDYERSARQKKTETQIRRVLSDICERNNGEELSAPTLDGWLTTWLGIVKNEIGSSSYDRYSHALELVREVDPALCAKHLDRVTQPEIERLRPKLHHVRSAATTNFAIKVLRMSFKRALGQGLVLVNPALGVKRVKQTDAELLAVGDGKKPFTREQVELLMSKADDEWQGMILAGIYSAGQRLGDIAKMRVGHVDLDANVARFDSEKTGRWTIIPIAPEWRADLVERIKAKAPNAPLFATAHRKFELGKGKPTDVSKSFRRLLHECGLAPKVGPRAGSVEGRRRPLPYSFHSFRHTMATWMANAGVSKTIAMNLVGPDSMAIHGIYTHIESAPKLAAILMATKDLKLPLEKLHLFDRSTGDAVGSSVAAAAA